MTKSKCFVKFIVKKLLLNYLLNLLHLLNSLDFLERLVIAFVPLPKTIVILYCF